MYKVVKAHAKINLAINVLDKRDDGYHNIDLVSLPLELHDNIEFEAYPKKYGTYVTCDDASIICDESNLVYKAYRLMKHEFGFDSGMRIKIYKNIPVEAGLGGGSADAGAIINGICNEYKLDVSNQKKIDLGIQIGSDVPYCIFNKPARVQSRGEKLTFINVKKNYYVLLVQPNQGLSTKGVYEVSDKLEKKFSNVDELVKGLELGDDALIEKNMVNGLQNAAIYILPEIQNIIDKLHALNFKKVMMSGSGSSVFALSEDFNKIKKAAKEFDETLFSIWITKTICPINKK